VDAVGVGDELLAVGGDLFGAAHTFVRHEEEKKRNTPKKGSRGNMQQPHLDAHAANLIQHLKRRDTLC
jgi:hypothetical protein